MSNQTLYQSLVAAMKQAAHQAGQQLIIDFKARDKLHVDNKAQSDFVSEADTKSDATIRSVLTRAFPDFGFLTEDGATGDDGKSKRFIVDSLDGTTNFLSVSDQWCVSIGAEIEGEIVAGVIFAPLLHKCFFAARHEGAYLEAVDGTERLYVSKRSDLQKAQVGLGFAFNGRPKPLMRPLQDRCEQQVAGIHSYRSVALECCYLAQGALDGYAHLQHGGGPWDFAAAKIIVEEAGGFLLSPDGVSNPLYGDDVLCLTPSLARDMWKLFTQTGVPASVLSKGPAQLPTSGIRL